MQPHHWFYCDIFTMSLTFMECLISLFKIQISHLGYILHWEIKKTNGKAKKGDTQPKSRKGTHNNNNKKDCFLAKYRIERKKVTIFRSCVVTMVLLGT